MQELLQELLPGLFQALASSFLAFACRVYLPFGATLESMLGKGTLDKEPVSAGKRPSPTCWSPAIL